MLRDGKHIKEPPPQIGKYWTRVEKPVQREKSSEEHFMESVLLGCSDSPLWKQLLARILRI